MVIEVMSEDGLSIPPPPPLPAPDLSSDDRTKSDADHKEFHFISNKCLWAEGCPELRKACQRYRICMNAEPGIWRYRKFESLLQVGPTCGIVALTMLLHQKMSPDDLLSIARHCGYTNNGEMFSVKSMYGLLKIHADLQPDIASIEVCRGRLTDYIQDLIDGCSILIPYDSDRNHAPCLKNGQSAHWALITGILSIDRTYDDTFTNVYVTAKHGKSLHLSIWKIREMEQSNRNLHEFSAKRLSDGLTYILPPNGLDSDEGLNEQFVLIKYNS